MIPPGSALGVLGGGQLGLMFLTEAQRMGYRVHVMDPDPECPCARKADLFVAAPLNDIPSALKMAQGCAVVTIETEHVDAAVLDALAKMTKVRPNATVLRHVHDRLAQRQFLESHKLPQPKWAAVDSESSLREAVKKVGLPAILKSRRGGYDGKGQVRIKTEADVAGAWAKLPVPCVLEGFVHFTQEVSVVLARDEQGHTAAWPVAENVHKDGILHTTVVPADIPEALARDATELAKRTMDALGHVGVAALEMFVADGKLLINEIAPRTHNSGHFTLGASATSQFEQHVRAVAGLPFGSTPLHQGVAMVNLLGDSWPEGGQPNWTKVLADPTAKLHLYGKKVARKGRKMGHILVLDDDASKALARAESLHASVKA